MCNSSELELMKPIAFDESQYRMLMSFNPLRGLNATDVENILDISRNGCISRLQLIYRILEQSDPTIATIMRRRQSALIGCDWEIRKRENASKNDELSKLADEQVAFLNEQFGRAEDDGSLIEAIKTLETAVFRGLAVVEPIFSDRGLERFDCYDSWNFAIDPANHDVYWNPKASDILNFQTDLKNITETNKCIISLEEAPVDGIALPIYIRSAYGEEAWAKLIARRGLPNCYIIAPPIANDKISEFATAAKKVAEGGNGALPNGSQVITERTDPGNSQAFDLFLAHQQKQILLVGTGGILGSLAEATGLGSGVADAHQETWREIIKFDAFKIANLINRYVANKLLEAAFPNQQKLAFFSIDTATPKSATEILDCAVKASQAGLAIDPVQLSEMTGFKISKAETQAAPQNVSQTTSGISRMIPNEKTDETTITKEEVPQKTPEEPEVKEETEEKEIVENVEIQEEPKEEEPKEEVKTKASLLKAFDTVINPIRSLVGKLFKAKTIDEEKQILNDIEALTKKIEQQEENEYIAAVQDMMEKESNEQRT